MFGFLVLFLLRNKKLKCFIIVCYCCFLNKRSNTYYWRVLNWKMKFKTVFNKWNKPKKSQLVKLAFLTGIRL